MRCKAKKRMKHKTPAQFPSNFIPFKGYKTFAITWRSEVGEGEEVKSEEENNISLAHHATTTTTTIIK